MARRTCSHAGLLGCVQQRKTRQGATVSVYRADQADLDDTAGSWATVCETHGSILNHEALAVARRFAVVPNERCVDCQER